MPKMRRLDAGATSLQGSGAPAPRAGPIAALQADYMRRIEAFEMEIAPRLVTREFHGYDTDDEAESEKETEAWAEAGFLEERLRAFHTYKAPCFELEKLVTARFAPTIREAGLVLLCSPSAALAQDADDIRWRAGDAATLDLLRVALLRGHYKPDAAKREMPSAELLLAPPPDAESLEDARGDARNGLGEP